MLKIKYYLPVIALAALLILTSWIYLPGLRGGFLFDDYPNLQELGSYGGVVDLETFKSFVFNGVSSPLGRPLSLASFLLDDNTWPTQASYFKATNLKIHLLVGLLLCWSTLKLLLLFNIEEKKVVWIALLNCAIWMLHPYMVSTTLYIVQRMAQLAALFVLMGLLGYFHGRLLLAKNKIVPAYLWMSASVTLGTLLALLSKENGILLPLMIVSIEFCFPKNIPRLFLWWRLMFLWVPSLAVFVLLAKEINFSPDAWPQRPFTQPERILTEFRILWEYLSHLYVPRIEGRGLFQDGYQFSRGFFHPITTSLSIIGLIILLAVIVIFRKRFPLLALSLLFFFTAHLLESTVLGLELYFEHRNYLASVFLFLPIALLLVNLGDDGKLWVALVGGILSIAMLSFLTWQRTNLWSNTKNLEIYWAASTPESPRAQNKLGSALLERGLVDESIIQMERSVEKFPKSSLLTVNTLLIKLYIDRVEEADFIRTAEMLKQQPFDAQAVVGLRNLVEKVIDPEVNNSFKRYALNMLEEIQTNSNYNKVYLFKKIMPYLKARLHLSLKEYDKAYSEFSVAIPMYSETDAALSMVAEMANADRPVEALLLFKAAQDVFKVQSDKTLKRSRAVYSAEFDHLQKILNENLNALGIYYQESDANLKGAK